jgi:alpha-L-fucosidase
MKERENEPLGAEDIRFTSRGNALYAICPQWPGQQATIRSLGSGSAVPAARISQVSMLGAPGTLSWSQGQDGLTIQAPPEKPCQHAYTFKIVLKD